MAKFKKGDRVKSVPKDGYTSSNIPIGTYGTIVDPTHEKYNGYIVMAEWDGYGQDTWHEDYLALAEPTYTPITPKVGQKYRVVKANPSNCFSVGNIITYMGDHDFRRADGRQQFMSDRLTTEYLELVDEPKGDGVTLSNTNVQQCVDDLRSAMIVKDRYSTHPMYVTSDIIKLQDEPKLTTMQKLTSALKRALSSDKQALYKTGIINGGLELSVEGRVAYVNALFQNEGDHKAALAEMVEAAKEEIKDNE